jgi:hypothetical protein
VEVNPGSAWLAKYSPDIEADELVSLSEFSEHTSYSNSTYFETWPMELPFKNAFPDAG